MVSISKEDYLRALYILEERKTELKSKYLADYLKVSKPSVSEMVGRLNGEGLIIYKKYSILKFTTKGRNLAKKLTLKHRIIELFLRDILHLKISKIHEEANRLEHAFSDSSINQMRKLLKNPKKDPHGKIIPY